MQTDDGRLFVIAGKSRSGKTAWTVRETKRMPRVIAFDTEDQWAQLPGWRRITTQKALYDAVQKAGAARLAFVPSGDIQNQFNFWAGCAFYWGRYMGGCAVIAEELADVTSTAKAPGNWGVLLRRGLKRGIFIYAISQRWAEADKTAIGNASDFVCFSMLPMDVEYMAKRTGIAAAELAALQRIDAGASVILPYVRLAESSGAIERGKLVFRKK